MKRGLVAFSISALFAAPAVAIGDMKAPTANLVLVLPPPPPPCELPVERAPADAPPRPTPCPDEPPR